MASAVGVTLSLGIFRVETFTKNLAVQLRLRTAVVHTAAAAAASFSPVCVMKWGGEDNQRPTTDFSSSTLPAEAALCVLHLTLDTETEELYSYSVLKVKSQCF